MNIEQINKKTQEYQKFIEDKLKVDLKEIQVILKQKVSKHKDWKDVKQVVKCMKEFKENDEDMGLRLDIGNDIILAGDIADYETTHICIGLGYMLEMNYEEAIKYSDVRLKLLKKEIQHFRKLAVDVKAHIKMMLLAINELQASNVK